MDHRIIWLAGLWDGEGSIGVTIYGRGSKKAGSSGLYMTPAVQLSMTCKATIDEAVAVLTANGVTATSYSYREKDPTKHLDAHYLHVGRLGDVATSARLMLPYAVTKKRQWEAILEYVDSRLTQAEIDDHGRVRRGGKAAKPFTDREVELARILRALNGRGPAAKKREAQWLAKLNGLKRAT